MFWAFNFLLNPQITHQKLRKLYAAYFNDVISQNGPIHALVYGGSLPYLRDFLFLLDLQL